MPTPNSIPIDALAAPANDGGVLIWPNGVALASLAEQNHAYLTTTEVAILDRPLREWRQTARGDRPVILAGHQPEFLHPGVWAKHPAVRRLADRIGGIARFLLVDSDVPNQLVLAWPAFDEGRLRRAWAAAPGSANGLSFAQFPAVSDDDWRSFFDLLPKDSMTTLGDYIDAFVSAEPSSNGKPADYVTRWKAGIRTIEAALGVPSIEYLSVAGIFSGRAAMSDAASAFTAHLILSAERFAAAYNDALQSYRLRRGIRGKQHPIPDLHLDADRIELPFWVVADGRPRLRLFVSRATNEQVQLFAAGERDVIPSLALRAGTVAPSFGLREGSEARPIATLGVKELRDEPASLLQSLGDAVGIRPRALALTLFARLLTCDLFIHGIGGAKYDQITDDLLRNFFGIAPPDFACVSATLRLPLEMHDVSPSDSRLAKHQLRDLRYNPQRYLDISPDGRISSLLDQREAAIRDAEAVRAGAPRDRSARRRAYVRIRQANHALLEASPSAVSRMREQSARIDRQLAHNAVARSREWFLALHPTARLKTLVDHIQREMS